MILQRVIDRLDSVYPNIPIYVNTSPQDRKLPSFSVAVLESNIMREFQGRFWVNVSFGVTYLPDVSETVHDLQAINFSLLFALERIPNAYGFYSARSNEARIVDGAVVANASYSIYVKEKMTPDELMRQLHQSFVMERS